MRIQFHRVPGAVSALKECAANELVVRLQPEQTIYWKVINKVPGLKFQVQQMRMDLLYADKFRDNGKPMPEAYERLLLEVLAADHSNFVSARELDASWRIFTPILNQLAEDKVKPLPYLYGSRGPSVADELAHRYGMTKFGGGITHYVHGKAVQKIDSKASNQSSASAAASLAPISSGPSKVAPEALAAAANASLLSSSRAAVGLPPASPLTPPATRPASAAASSASTAANAAPVAASTAKVEASPTQPASSHQIAPAATASQATPDLTDVMDVTDATDVTANAALAAPIATKAAPAPVPSPSSVGAPAAAAGDAVKAGATAASAAAAGGKVRVPPVPFITLAGGGGAVPRLHTRSPTSDVEEGDSSPRGGAIDEGELAGTPRPSRAGGTAPVPFSSAFLCLRSGFHGSYACLCCSPELCS